ncbi:MAG: hypothetical protein RIB46_15470 [Pseudomonadales bacterium]
MVREILSAAAIGLTFVLFVPYVRAILGGRLKPHVFSWVIWGMVTFTVFLAQLAGGGGVGAWAIGVSGIITFYIAALAWRHRGDTAITRGDCAFLVIAASALPVWAITAEPVWAVVILTGADLAGFGPTLRRAYAQPHLESPLFFALAGVRNGLVVLALEQHSTTTVLFPAAVGLACLLLAALLLWRRAALAVPGR